MIRRVLQSSGRTTHHERRTAFTLIELLVVIAIISLLVSILLPSLSKAKEVTRRAVCATNQRNISQALMVYATEYEGHFPPHVAKYSFLLMVLDGADYETAHIYGEAPPGVHIQLNYKLDVVDSYMGGGKLLICPSNNRIKFETSIQTPAGPSSSGYYFLDSCYAILAGHVTWGLPDYEQDSVWFSPDGMKSYSTLNGVDGLSAGETPMIVDFNWAYGSDGSIEKPGRGNHDAGGGNQPNQNVPGENVGYLDGSTRWIDIDDLQLGWNYDIFMFW